jgi:hypothetical protein
MNMVCRSAYGQDLMTVILDYGDHVFVQPFSPRIEDQGIPVLYSKHHLDVDLRVGAISY